MNQPLTGMRKLDTALPHADRLPRRSSLKGEFGSPPQIEVPIHEFRKHLMIPSFQCSFSFLRECGNLFHVCPDPRIPFQPPPLHRAMYLQQQRAALQTRQMVRKPRLGERGPVSCTFSLENFQRSAFRSSAPSHRSRVSQDFRRPLQSLRLCDCCSGKRIQEESFYLYISALNMPGSPNKDL
jgi:hypothetical protein